jgi:hypothetical protein
VPGWSRNVRKRRILVIEDFLSAVHSALHMVAVLDGEDAAQTIALMLEYNWQPDNSYVRGAMADQFIPDLSKRPTLSKVRGAREVFTSPRPDR